MKRFAAISFGMLLASVALLPLNASADTGFYALLFVTPDGQTEGETVDLNLETFLDGVPTDADTISIGADPLYDDITFTKTATGKYHATYDITATDQTNNLATIAGTAELGNESSFVRSFYEIPPEPGLDATLRVLSGPAAGGAEVGPGDKVVFEARSYMDGVLSEVEPITFTVDWYGEGTTGNDPADPVKIKDGVYQTTLEVPNDLRKSREYWVEAKITTTTTRVMTASAHPFEVYTVPSDTAPDPVDTMAYVMELYASRDHAPIEGATVEVTGEHISFQPYQVTELGPYTATTDANGNAQVYVEEGLDPSSTWILKTIAENHEVIKDLGKGPLGGSGWSPKEPSPAGCDAMLETDPTQFHAGETAHLTYTTFYAATPSDDREPLPTTYVARYLWGSGDSGTAVAGEAQTDADGKMVIDFDIPDAWTKQDSLNVQVVCPSGDVSRDTVHFSGKDPFEADDLTVEASGSIGGNVPVTATYTGSAPLDGAVAVATILPAKPDSGSNAFPRDLSTPLTLSGSKFTGSLQMPSWLPPGDYVVNVRLTTEGATDDRSSEFSTAASIYVTMGAAPEGNGEPPTGGNETGGGGNETGGGGNETGGGGSGSFLPGVPAGMVLGAAAVAALVAARWRREAE